MTDELMCCSAIGKSVNGMATQMTESRSSLARSSGSICMSVTARPTRVVIDRGSAHSAAAPEPTRNSVIRPGGSASRPMSMKTNDDPQIAATETKSAQSCG